ncbi:hypothetical protein [Mesorhizobium sp. KR2-14]|uniref:hypothetical protein n=1 Tax=Mesorhizobium sp. KR2-14 TaxID=3156610 RepID=UPI0032B54696
MSSNNHQQYLGPDDMALIERVLAKAGFRKSTVCSTISSDAARFLVGEFQDGVTQQLELALSLDQYMRRRDS